MKIKTLLLIVLITVSYIGFSQNVESKKQKREYKILNVSKTERYFVVKSESDSIPVILVIDKKSDQLKRIELQNGHSYKFKTYSYWDVVALGGPYFHQVDGIDVWHSDNYPQELHFTDGMGNEYFEDNIKKQ